MVTIARRLQSCVLSLVIVCAVACGGKDLSNSTGGNTPVTPAANVVAVSVDAGPSGNSANTLFTSVTLCAPGSTTQCQTIDHVQVDTGSYGLRVLGSVLSLTLPTMAADGNSLVECTQFVDGYSWGPVALADVQISGESAASVPIQVIGGSKFPVPADCAGSTGVEEDTVTAFGANGVLGIGVFEQDCGAGCSSNVANGDYYACSQAACVPSVAPLTSQVLNPVPLFAADNNGTIIQLPSVAGQGAASVTGSLIFGIDTQTNNTSGNQTVLGLDDNGSFTTVFNGQTLMDSFIDSGTNGIFFNDSSITACTDSSVTGFYCPAGTQTFSATLKGQNNSSTTASFSVGNAQSLLDDNPTFTVFPTLAGTYPGTTDTFDWGLPFYYGRRVATAIEAHSSSVGTGPYVAF